MTFLRSVPLIIGNLTTISVEFFRSQNFLSCQRHVRVVSDDGQVRFGLPPSRSFCIRVFFSTTPHSDKLKLQKLLSFCVCFCFRTIDGTLGVDNLSCSTAMISRRRSRAKRLQLLRRQGGTDRVIDVRSVFRILYIKAVRGRWL
jgi:hypothetical protein